MLESVIARQKTDALWLTRLPDIRWATGFTGSNAILIVRPDGAHLLTDGRYRTQAEQEVQGAQIHVPEGNRLVEHAAEAGLLGDAERVLYQADDLTMAAAEHLWTVFPDVAWMPGKRVLDAEVAVKRPDEIDCMRRAQAITEAVFDDLLGLLREGLTEKEVSAEIVYRHLKRGASRMSFDPIVASGPNAALPHARPTDRALRGGEVVLLDFGCVVDGYASDMTRTVVLGTPDDEIRRVYGVVREAQARAIEAAHAGVAANVLDAAARDVIKEAGYGDHFTHSLGHGIGLQTHEWPRVSYAEDVTLPAGAVVTIEPGVYLPGRFGVRIEDMVVLRDGGCENLTRASKELIQL